MQPDLDICPNCGTLAELDSITGWCSDCTPTNYDRVFYERYADEILDYRELGYSYREACEKVRNDIRPKCLNCGEVLHRARADAKFCGKPPCRKAWRKYRKEREAA